MEDNKKAVLDELLDEVSGGLAMVDQNGEKKSLIRTVYDSGSELEIFMEDEIVKAKKGISELFRPKEK